MAHTKAKKSILDDIMHCLKNPCRRKSLTKVLILFPLMLALTGVISNVRGEGDGDLLKRSPEETCHGCHKTDKNSPSDPDSIKSHNSRNTGSTKWSSEGGWGVPDGKYGEFVCTTCHTPHDTRNIYLIRETIHTSDSSLWETSGAAEVTVVFKKKATSADPNPGSSDGVMGADYVPNSSKICEVCHSLTEHFRWNGTGPEQTHDNVGGAAGLDCTRCHSHKNGFAHGGGSGGTGCIPCHGHDAGAYYDPDMSLPYTAGTNQSEGRGTYRSHSTHTESISGISPGSAGDDDHKGPGIYCADCHDTTKIPLFKDGKTLANTTVCDPCHSPEGTYDGVNDPSIGAKAQWKTGVYAGSDLVAGKEKWCAGCHDEEPSVIQSVNAPNVIGDEDGSYIYGTGWGYYKTGHGVPSGVAYPYKEGLIEPPLVGGASRPVECGACHDFSTRHTDGLARTYNDEGSSTTDPSVYRMGYRLKMVNGQEPMQVPWTNGGLSPANNSDRYRLCAQCHKTGSVFTDSNYLTDTNLITTGGDGTKNRHAYHLNDVNLHYASDWDPGYDGAGATSRMTCVTCHNVHGSTQLVMVRDGKLTNREPGLKIWYYNEDSVVVNESNNEPPYPENTPLAASDGTIWRGDTAGNLCSHCHHNDNTVKKNRTPFQDVAQSPQLAWTGENGYVTDGVDPDNAKAKSYFEFRIKYTDTNNDPPSPIQVWVDTNDNGIYEAGEKHPMAEADPSDINNTDGKIYTFAMPISKFGDNNFNYRFFASDGSLTVEFPTAPDPDRTVTVTNNSPVLSWTGEAYYESFGVHPATGKNGWNFTFRIKYADVDGDSPTGLKQVWIDADESGSYGPGEKHDMAEVSGDYTTGMIYAYSTTLNYVTAGTVDYTFRFNDGTDNAAAETGPLSDNVATVVNSTNNPPRLDWIVEDCYTKGVKPVKGLATGNFTFRVKYTDPDNQCPPTAGDIQVIVNGTPNNLTAGAGNCNTGRTYSTTLQLNSPGAFSYYFTANDGTHTATGEPANTSGKQVTVLSTANAVGVRTGSGDTAPWYNSINDAITATGANVTVLVYEGAYNENVMIDDVPATDEGIILESVCGAELTTINASGGNAVHVQAIDTSATIDGFTITGGANGINNIGSPVSVKNSIIRNNGRGIFTYNAGNVLTVEDTIIRNNSGATRGAGIEFSAGGPHSIADSVIKDNTTAGQGGALFIQNTSIVSISKTPLSGNSAGGQGGAIYLNNSSMTVDRTVINGNTSSSTGGGLFLQNSGSTTLTNSNIVDNTASSMGGGLHLITRTVDMVNCTVSGNSLTETTNGQGGGLYANGSTVSIKNSIFWANQAGGNGSGHECFTNGGTPVTFTYSDVPNNLNSLAVSGSGSFSVDSTNIEADPLFIDSINGDYHLKEISPAIDQGTAAGAPSDDIDGNSRPQPSGGDFDIGSDEYSTEVLEAEPPVVTGFTATTPSNDREVPITLFTATDNVGVTGYAITTSAVPPSIGDAGWSGTPPVTYLVLSDGTHTLYPWARDAAGNISAVFGSPRTVVVDATAPMVTAFTVTTLTNNLNIPITVFTANDNIGVTGYKITESSTPPSAGGGGWSGTAPATYTVVSAGTYTLYPWAKDALDNVSPIFGSPQTVVVDLTPPQVSTTVPSNGATGVTPNSPVTINWNENIDCATVTASTVTISPQPGTWTRTSCSGSQAVFTPDSQAISTLYTVTVTTSVKDIAGNTMASNYQFSYTTAGAANNAPLLSWASANCLTEGVRPGTGAVNADFEFRVKYSDADNQCPSSMQVTVSGTPYDLTSNDGASCQTGRTYWRSIAIAGAGELNYSFSASDGINAATGVPTTSHVVSVINTTYVVRPSGGTYNTIQSAVNATSSAATVLVYPNSDFTAATYASFSVSSKSNRTIKAVCGEDLTVVSGGASTVVFQDSTGCTLEGFSVTGATSWYGVSLLRADNATVKTCKIYSNPTGININDTGPANIDNCKIYDNTNYGITSSNANSSANITNSEIYWNGNASSSGAGIYLNTGIHSITDSIIRNNPKTGSATQGGGIYFLSGSSPSTITNTIIKDNSAASGGGLTFNSGKANFYKCTITGNVATTGGAVYAYGTTTANFENCVVAGNQAGKAGAVYVNNISAGMSFVNTTFADNQATSTTGGVFDVCGIGSLTVRNSIFWNNTASGLGDNCYKECGGSDGYMTITDSDITTGAGYTDGKQVATGGAMINPAQDPLFVGGSPYDYHIQSGSPVRGQASATYAPDDDIDGDTRPYTGGDTGDDMGADEYVP